MKKPEIADCASGVSPLEAEARMSNRRSNLFPLLLLVAVAAPLPAAHEPTSKKPNGDASFKGDRRPGILAAPTEEPTGENALLYRRLGRLKPDELLDFVSED